jgi:monoterpene epsilon-lactone hydrolase
MPPNALQDSAPRTPWLVVHAVGQEDSVAAAALRAVVAPMKGKLAGTAGRALFDEIMERVALPEGVAFDAATVGGTPGWWAKPARTHKGAAILHVHGGWFNLGTARAFRHFAGHIALSAGIDAFIPDYRLSPEHPFPAAVRDLEACYSGLVDLGITKIAFTGDSAGGDLALVLLSIASARASKNAVAPVGAVVFSPITDLALTGESFETRAEADPYFTKSQAAGLVHSYLGANDPKDPLASPLYADLSGLPPIRVHVGDDEVLLDDSRRYVEHAAAAGVDAKLDLWMSMPHGFVTNVGGFKAAAQALKASGEFLATVISARNSADVAKGDSYEKETDMAPRPENYDGGEAVEPGADAQEQDRLLDVSREEDIRRRAYEIYLERGEEPGRDVEDWLQAERELMQDQSTESGE